MKRIIQIFMLLITVATFSQVPTNITNTIQQACPDGANCTIMTFGCCFGDGFDHPDETECAFPNFQTYFITEDVFVNWGTVRLEHCVIEARNGANIININNSFEFSTSCDVDGQVTQIVYLGETPGRMYNSVEEYNATLGITEPQNAYKLDVDASYYDMTGKQINNIEYASKGIYIVKYVYEGKEKTKKIIR